MDILNEKIEGLVKKAEKSGMPYSILKKVYDRGMAAWKTGHRPGTTPQQWAFARVNSFVTKSSGTWGKADADLAKQVRGEEVERRKTASEMLGQVKEGIKPYVSMMKKDVGGRRKLHYRVLDKDEKEIFVTLDKKKADDFLKKNISKLKSGTIKPIEEKLGKDADAGDYVKDFRKSDAPQFKGKSDKKKQKMAIAAYLDSKEEKDLDESLKFKYAVVDTSKNNEVIAMSSDEKDMQDTMRRRKERSLKVVKLKRPTKNDKMIGYPLKEENCPKCDNDPCKCENIQEQIKTFNRNALTPSDKSKLAKHFDKLANDRTTTGNEKPYYQTLSRYVMGNVKPFEFNDMIGGAPEQVLGSVSRNVMKIIGKAKAKKFIPGFKEENIQESGHTDVPSMKTQVQIAMDALQKMNTELGKLSDEEELPTWWTNKVATAVSKLDGMADYIDAKHDQGQKMNESNNELNEARYAIRFDIKFMSPFYFPTRGKLNQSFADHVADELKKNGIVAKVKPGKPNTMELEFDSLVPKAKMIKTIEKRPPQGLGYGNLDYSGPVRMFDESNITEEKVFVVRFEKEGMRFAVPFSDMKRAKDGEKILKKSAGVSNVSVTKDILKPGVKFKRTQEGKIVAESKMGELFLDMQMDAQEMSERDFIKTYSKQGFQAAELKRMHKEFNEEVDNSLMAQATRVISHTSIKEKIDPADIDNIATADDRKAADKNIIIQLRRAQDMQGKADVTFKDKPNKKEKLDIRVINKALDMFDKMKPNDKAKMQTIIGKSYRDLLKTVQRGRV